MRFSEGSTFKRCGCRNPDTKKKYSEGKCPKLPEKDHGSWWARYSAPAGSGERRQPRLGPFKTESLAKKELRAVLAALDAGEVVAADGGVLLRDFLREWLAGKKRLAAGTKVSYEEAIALYYVPGLGHMKLADLREGHLGRLYEAMAQINNLPEGERPSELLRRLLAVRAAAPWRYERPGQTPGLNRKKPLTTARIKRVHAVISSALGTAVKQRRLRHNPATFVELPEVRPVRPLVWTDERVAYWRRTGKVPGPVMVWTPAQVGAFLDFTEEIGERLHPLWHLVATRGLRRGEGIGAMWLHSDLDAGLLGLLDDEEEDVLLKSEQSRRTVRLDKENVALLRAWRARQAADRLRAGETWIESGRVFTRPDGSPLRPDRVSQRFGELIERAGLPPKRLHDLRHCAASLMLAAGVDMKVVSHTLGHARYAFTADVYASVVPQVAAAAAEATVAIIPRRARGG